ncbi:hypothetical protein SAPIO_CDS6707 [Scedosporium apiospermum]|uniref:MARVEL domain-containing protein n=1 Tax=Pseudallescheria apiosperma TaxID=563466 RepID=A0A084G328_PSEDA|nr:uncharacterized protein SAPIO_CDS6707 [Scedosporium apiospermum]KEZ41740.1 hypothetical protein SAPIO_CDS6707 [Scedosporium apiospermum]
MERPIKVIQAPARVMWISKTVLRSLSLILGIALLGVVAAIAATSYDDDDYYYYSYGDSFLWLTLATGVALTGLLCAGSFCAIGYDDEGTGSAARRNALVALGVIITIVHFVLFVIACWETSVRNRAIRIIVGRDGVPLKGSENASTFYQAQQVQLGIAAPPNGQQAHLAAAPAVTIFPPVLFHQVPPMQNYSISTPASRPVGSDLQVVSQPGPAHSPSEISNAGPLPIHSSPTHPPANNPPQA